ncbi:cytochrome oxidase [Caldimonas brevitalea]|uniref:Cytochrome oxidase n=1 Tax=Caldimonas brevitalea TaxID=413882 RepID=A0A0G3BKY3_9BURK|nr:cbb3-type cytochrome oxidase assembly protein CcoS [Caldimonas brevitalea]AKJ28648.1 cytochrome oxidase [Caldimonas brevitalea]
MDILFLLVPLSVVLVLALLALFAWALFGGQFDNVEREGERILWDDARADPTSLDADQARARPAPEQSLRSI